MATPVQWGGEIFVEAKGGAPAFKALADGRFVAVYNDTEGGVNVGIYGQIFNGDGSNSGGELHVNTITVGNQYAGVATAFADGSFVVVWEDWSGDPTTVDYEGIDVRGQRYNANGTPAGSEFVVNTEREFGQDSPTITTLTNGNFVVAWYDDSWVTENSAVTRVQVFTAAGVPVGDEFVVNPDAAGNTKDDVSPSIVALSNGNYVVTWEDESNSLGDNSSSAIHGQVFEADGDLVGTEFRANTTITGSQSGGVVSALDNGRFVVVWNEDQDANPATNGTTFYTIRAQVFEANGTKDLDVSEISINTITSNSQNSPAVATLKDGRFIVAWTDASIGGDGSDPENHPFDTRIRAAVFNADGTPSGSELTVNTTATGEQGQPSITVLADGRVVIGWVTTNGGVADGNYAQIFDPRETAVTLNGTALGDHFQGTGLDDTLNGLNGNDRLGGGAGKDKLDGGAGTDILTGGLGDDTYRVDTASDLVIEATNQGNDTVITTKTYALAAGASVEILQTSASAGTTVIDLFGNASANTIIGNAAKNVLNGSGGADTLRGLLGDDTYKVDVAADVVLESSNQGNDTVNTTVSYTLAAGASVETLRTSVAGGTTVIDLTGNSFANLIQGNAAANKLNGGGGTDTLQGLLGDDTYTVDVASDIVIEAANQGTDTVVATASYTLAAGVSVEVMRTSSSAGTTAINFIGNAFNNTLQGNAGVNTLNGGGGADILQGLNGNDVLIGGAGKDAMAGGAGNDRFDFDAIADIGNGSAARDVVTDFALGDKIDLSTIDANGAGPGNTAFSFLATAGAAFTGAAGQLRWFKSDVSGTANDMTIIEGDIDGNKAADFQIQLTGLKTLTGGASGDFIL